MEMNITTSLVLEGGVPRTIKIPSSSEAGVKHTVILHCSCAGFRYGGSCRHLLAAAHVVKPYRKDGF